MSSASACEDTFFQAKRSHCLNSSSVFGAWSLYVVSSKIIQIVSRGFTSREFAGRWSFAIKFPNPPFFSSRLSNLCWSYLHTVVLETLKLWSWIFFTFLSCRIITHLLTVFSLTFLTHLNLKKKKNDHPLLGLSSKVFTFDHLFTYIVQTCSTV